MTKLEAITEVLNSENLEGITPLGNIFYRKGNSVLYKHTKNKVEFLTTDYLNSVGFSVRKKYEFD